MYPELAAERSFAQRHRLRDQERDPRLVAGDRRGVDLGPALAVAGKHVEAERCGETRLAVAARDARQHVGEASGARVAVDPPEGAHHQEQLPGRELEVAPGARSLHFAEALQDARHPLGAVRVELPRPGRIPDPLHVADVPLTGEPCQAPGRDAAVEHVLDVLQPLGDVRVRAGELEELGPLRCCRRRRPELAPAGPPGRPAFALALELGAVVVGGGRVLPRPPARTRAALERPTVVHEIRHGSASRRP